ncbi:unnamed protein product [Oppiella nova]|uniref:Uncharacterized protein n=1 Tax=Oppiella nova TaxID=334625 RepID=A0A7R9QQN3_9ACAR|nr:unnamed protein product [Oppiella nova]CAG2170276.1 unnamed protein product [Oppiella nova]
MACQAFSYNCERDAYKIIKLSNSLTAFQMAHEWDSDSVILDLLTIIVLFNDQRPDLINRDTVNRTNDWILTEEQRKLREKRHKEKDIKSKSQNIEEFTDSLSAGNLSQQLIAAKSVDILSEIIESNIISDERITAEVVDIECYLTDKEMCDILDDVYEKAVELEFAPIPLARPITDYMNTFNEMENNHLCELFNATSILKMDITPSTSEANTYLDAMEVLAIGCDQMVRRNDWILTEEQRKLREKRHKEKDIKSKSQNIEEFTDSLSAGNLSQQLIAAKSVDILSEIIESNIISDERITAEVMDIECYLTDKEMCDISDDVYEKAVELEFAPIPMARPITDYMNTFNEMESNYLCELFNATSILKMDITPSTSEANTYLDAMEVLAIGCDQMVRRLIKMAKNLSSFTNMSELDQLALIKYGSIELLIAIILFDPNRPDLTNKDYIK